MKKVLISTLLILSISGCAQKTKNATSKFIKDYKISYKIDEAIKKIETSMAKKNYKITYTFDHEKEAIKLKEMLYPTKTIELYNPKISTKLIQCNPTMSLDMPIRVSLYSKIDGEVHFTFTDPEYWSLKHNVKDAECINLLKLIKSDLYDLKDNLGAK